jgi:hypothetical protein
MGHRVIAEVCDYQGLAATIRARCAELGTTFRAVDELAGIPDGYLSKCVVPTNVDAAIRMRAFGRHSLGPVLGALGLKLLVVEDAEALAKVKPRLVPSQWPECRRLRHSADDPQHQRPPRKPPAAA